MSVQKIKMAGDPLLHQQARDVKQVDAPEIKRLIQDLIDTLSNENNGVGIAATQLGIPLKVMIIRITETRAQKEKCDPIPLTVYINPKMETVDAEGMVTYPEGCFSMPGLVGKVPRFKKINFTALDVAGNHIEGSLKNFPARVFQHEYDHLQGVLYWTHIQNCADFGFRDHLPL